MSKTLGVGKPLIDYIHSVGVREHPALARCRRETQAGAQGSLQISPEQGAFMALVAQATAARRALEVGVFTGYSAMAVALAMQAVHGSRAELVACELSAELIETATGYWREAGVEHVVRPIIGPALDTLATLRAQGQANSFDFIFIDADKLQYEAYYEAALTLVRPGGLLLFDNMLWGGLAADEAYRTPKTLAIRALSKRIYEDERVDMTLATIGDGIAMVIKR
jgi:caffeoyl-CoA O-methyltransferase